MAYSSPTPCANYPSFATSAYEYGLGRRALRKYLYRELEHAQGGGSSIFQRCSPPGEVSVMFMSRFHGRCTNIDFLACFPGPRVHSPHSDAVLSSKQAPFELKPGVLFHLYSTMLPCGDASVYLNGKQGRGLRPMEPALSLGGDGPEVPTKDICSKHWPCENVRRGKLRAKMECGRSWTPLPNNSGGYPPSLRFHRDSHD